VAPEQRFEARPLKAAVDRALDEDKDPARERIGLVGVTVELDAALLQQDADVALRRRKREAV
jgi:hypothetical protein